MKKFTLASLVLTLFFAFSLSGHSQDKDAWIETFDSQTSNSYGTGTITIDGRDWTRQGAGNFSYANTKMGSPAFTINDNTPGAFIASPSLSTLGTVSFKYAYTNGSSSNMFIVQKSTDGGTIFTDLDTHTLGEGSNETYVNYSFDVNDNSASVIIKITNDDQDAHIFIEDFTVTNFGEEPPPVVQVQHFTPLVLMLMQPPLLKPLPLKLRGKAKAR
ncbi:MAG: hypothetical protein B7C24_08960 [Bacteroidetes bacterium 4572_77]|nr:MAG: hypothetical protein B7C24_08960 [Bacteroidetes bacterium 4572_77]